MDAQDKIIKDITESFRCYTATVEDYPEDFEKAVNQMYSLLKLVTQSRKNNCNILKHYNLESGDYATDLETLENIINNKI